MPKKPETRPSNCPIHFALGIFGDRWTLIVLRDLLLRGRCYFRELLNGGEGIASNILTERLKRLEQRGIISRRPDPQDRRQMIYEPTETGMSLIPVLLEIAAWGATNDPNTGAPADFAPNFYSNRDTVIANYKSFVPQN